MHCICTMTMTDIAGLDWKLRKLHNLQLDLEIFTTKMQQFHNYLTIFIGVIYRIIATIYRDFLLQVMQKGVEHGKNVPRKYLSWQKYIEIIKNILNYKYL